MAQQQSPLDIKSGPLFPLPFRFVAVMLIIAALALFSVYPLVSLMLLLAGAGMLSAQAGIEFYKDQRSYREYFTLFFIRFGKLQPYHGVEKVFINSGQVSQRVYTAHTTTSAVFSNVQYRGFVKFSDGTKLLLARSKKKSSIEEVLQKVASYLNAAMMDHSH